MKRLYPAALLAAVALLPVALWAQTMPKPVVKPSIKQPTAMIWVRWDLVDVPQTEWDTLAPRPGKAGSPPQISAAAEKTLVEKLKAGHYRTVSGPTLTTADGVEAKINLETKIPFGPAGKRSFETVGQYTNVLPTLNADGTVTIALSLRDAEVVGPPPTKDAAPLLETTSLTTTCTARAGETLAVGGLESGGKARKSVRVLLLTPTVMRFGGPKAAARP